MSRYYYEMKLKSLSFSLFIIFLGIFNMACSHHPKLRTVDQVDIKKFMGKWYVISHIPTFIEKKAFNAHETYTYNDKEKRIDVEFVFNQGAFDGDLKSYHQKAFVHDSSGAEWRIQFFWPIKFPYLVIDLAEDYSYTVISIPSRSYVWIMARRPFLSTQTYNEIIKKLKENHFDVSKIRKVPQKY